MSRLMIGVVVFLGLMAPAYSASPTPVDENFRYSERLPESFNLMTVVDAFHDANIDREENVARQEAALKLTNEISVLGEVEGMQRFHRVTNDLRKSINMPIPCYGDKRCLRHQSRVNQIEASTAFRAEYRTKMNGIVPAKLLAEFVQITDFHASLRAQRSEGLRMGLLDVASLIILIVAIVWTARRRFYRRNAHGNEEFESFSGMVGSLSGEAILVLLALGFFLYRLSS